MEGNRSLTRGVITVIALIILITSENNSSYGNFNIYDSSTKFDNQTDISYCRPLSEKYLCYDLPILCHSSIISNGVHQEVLCIDQHKLQQQVPLLTTVNQSWIDCKPSLSIVSIIIPRVYPRSSLVNWDVAGSRSISKRVYLLLYLIISGDIHCNPGPNIMCPACNGEIKSDQISLKCQECEKMFHANCEGFGPIEHIRPSQMIYWECPRCCLPNICNSLFSDSDVELSNEFTLLESLDESDIFNPEGLVTSTPKGSKKLSYMKRDKNDNQNHVKRNPCKIKVMIVNCRSLKSERKQHDLLDLIESHKPDVICGQESHIDSSFADGEIFPAEYNVSRKDRDIHGGGVFVAVSNRLISTTEYSLNSKCEVMWCKICIAGNKPLYVGSYYRPTNDKQEPLQELNTSLSKISQNGSLPNVILGGDFNLPSIKWDNNTIQANPQYGYKVNRLLLDIVEDHGLQQHVNKPTRLNNILDLLLTTNPDLVEEIQVFPGMSDHSVVTGVVNVKAKVNKQPPRKHGFRSGHSCESQLLITIEDLAHNLDQKHQTDLQILDFQKAFDVVPHQRLLQKLDFYGVRGSLLTWINKWLTTRTQRVVVDGETSDPAKVKSGVPQGTVLGPLMFLLYINDITDHIDSSTKIRLFADDCLLYRVIHTSQDTDILQKDLTSLCNWAEKWQMRFNTAKCKTLRITTKKNPLISTYTMCNDELEYVSHHPYLGVNISHNLKWSIHINNIIAKANKALWFLRRNLWRCPQKVKEQLYFMLVRPHLEYACAVWAPFTSSDIHRLEMIQHRAARFVTKNYNRTEGSMTQILNKLQWPTLEQRRKQARLTTMFKIQHESLAIPKPDYVQRQVDNNTRQYHPAKYRVMRTRINSYKFSFGPVQ
ncbi:uncharacterized protein [Amphiura filiformis]|uniref:uncharacterized protein n=1 Tax=Amphiura filiformis TaxID=82378 RepID=UPI003B21D3A2